MSTQSNTYDYLLILRGLSALAVVFCHYSFQLSEIIHINWFDWLFNPFGYVPVLIFFTLSGHLITLGFLQHRHEAYTFSGVKKYYFSRALRILPLYYLSILICAVIYWKATTHSPERVLSLFIFLENYKPENGIIFNHVYWTMPIEVLYFALAPGIYILSKKAVSNFGLLKTVLFVLFAFFIFTVFLFRNFEHTQNGILLTRKEWLFTARFDFFYNLQAFLLGGLSAFFIHNTKTTPRIRHRLLITWFFSISLIIWIIFHTTTHTATTLNQFNLASSLLIYGLIPLIGFWLATIAYLNKFQSHQNNNHFLRILERLGKISYAMYLFHMPILTITEQLVTSKEHITPNHITSLIAVALTFLFSIIAYKFFEKPIMNLRRDSRETQQKLITAATQS